MHHYDPCKCAEGGLGSDSAGIDERPGNENEIQPDSDEKGKAKAKSRLPEPAKRAFWAYGFRTNKVRSPSVETSVPKNEKEEEKLVATATQSLCPDCFNIEEDRICDTYAKRVNAALKDCDTSGLTETEIFQICKTMETEHQQELVSFHNASGYVDRKTNAGNPLIKTETLRGFEAIAGLRPEKPKKSRSVAHTLFKKTDVSSNNLALVRAEWGTSRSGTPWLNGKTGETEDSVTVARPRRDGTRFAFPVRISKTDLKEFFAAPKAMVHRSSESSTLSASTTAGTGSSGPSSLSASKSSVSLFVPIGESKGNKFDVAEAAEEWAAPADWLEADGDDELSRLEGEGMVF